MNLISTRIGYINGGGDGDHNITLSLANTRPINLYGNKNTMNTGSGYVGTIETEKYTGLNISRDVGSLNARGDAWVKLAGNVDLIELREGDHDLRLKTGFAVKSNFSMAFSRSRTTRSKSTFLIVDGSIYAKGTRQKPPM
ncbi:MAG: hypothetical protein JJ897_05775 [Marinibacterium sp.]|nr:hypothetical protein [Marinibacterium sp.]